MASNPTNTLLEQIKNMSETDKVMLRELLGRAEAAPAKRFVKGGKFWTTVPRCIDNRYITASPEHPALVTFADHLRTEVDDKGMPVDRTLTPYKEASGPPVPPKQPDAIPPYAEKRSARPSKKGESGQRPSDEDPAK